MLPGTTTCPMKIDDTQNERSVCPSRRVRRKEETKERLFEAGMHLLSERDFDAVTVEMITEAAEVSKGTFFNYFANKEAIVGYFFETQLLLMTDILQGHQTLSAFEMPLQWCNSPHTESAEGSVGGPLWRQIVMMTHLIAERDGRSKRFTRNQLALTLTNPYVRTASLNVRQRVIETGVELVQLGQLSGELRTDLPADALADYLINVYFNTLFSWAQSEADDSLHDAIERIYALVWEGIGHTPEQTLPNHSNLIKET